MGHAWIWCEWWGSTHTQIEAVNVLGLDIRLHAGTYSKTVKHHKSVTSRSKCSPVLHSIAGQRLTRLGLQQTAKSSGTAGLQSRWCGNQKLLGRSMVCVFRFCSVIKTGVRLFMQSPESVVFVPLRIHTLSEDLENQPFASVATCRNHLSKQDHQDPLVWSCFMKYEDFWGFMRYVGKCWQPFHIISLPSIGIQVCWSRWPGMRLWSGDGSTLQRCPGRWWQPHPIETKKGCLKPL